MTQRRLLTGAAAVAVATIAVGLGVRPFGHTMGTALSPFVMSWLPRASVWTLLAVPVLAAVVWLVPAVLRARAYPVAVAALAAVAGLAVNVIPLGPLGWDVVFTESFEAKNEYLSGLGALHYGPHFFLDRFAQLIPSFPINVGGHPPGLLLALHLTGITTPAGFAALCVLAVAACAPSTYALARAVDVAEDRARLAGVLAALSPALLLFGISSADAIFALLGTVSAWLLLRHRPLGVGVFAVSTFFAWSLLAIGVFVIVVARQREGWRAAVALAVACGVALLVLNGGLALTTGYDPIGTLRATSTYYDHSLARIRPYAFWWIGSPVAWAVMMGPAIAGGWLVAARRRDPVAIGLLAVIAIASIAGFTKAETERIWLPFVPLACVAAASVLSGRRALFAGLIAQGVVVSLLFQTIW